MQINDITGHYAKNSTVSKGMREAYHHKVNYLFVIPDAVCLNSELDSKKKPDDYITSLIINQ